MSRPIFSPKARHDLENIWDFTAARWNVDQAETYVRMISVAIDGISANPLKGSACDDVRAGYRKFRVGSHVVFYRIASMARIEVVRILHQRMDFERHLG